MPVPDWANAHYVRLYASLRQDHPSVYWADELLAWYARLLFAADRLWPQPADVPAAIPIAVYERLVLDGCIEHVPDGQYRIHGMTALRLAESTRGVAGGKARAATAYREGTGRWASNATSNGHQQPPEPLRVGRPATPSNFTPAPDQRHATSTEPAQGNGTSTAGDQRTSDKPIQDNATTTNGGGVNPEDSPRAREDARSGESFRDKVRRYGGPEL
jgi:hypothetical protein